MKLRSVWLATLALAAAAAAPAQDGLRGGVAPMRVSGGVMAAQLLTRVDPVYPPIARAAHVSGAVVLHALIGADGLVERLEAVSGPEMLRASAIEAVRHWTYKPYLLNGEPTEVDTIVTVNYNIAEPPPASSAAPPS